MSLTLYPAVQAQYEGQSAQANLDREEAFNMLMSQVQAYAKLGQTSLLVPSNEFFTKWSLEELFTSQGYKVQAVGNPILHITISWEPAYPAISPNPPIVDFGIDPSWEGLSGWPRPVQLVDMSTNSPTRWFWSLYSGDVLIGNSYLQNPTFQLPSLGIYSVVLVASNAGGSTTGGGDFELTT